MLLDLADAPAPCEVSAPVCVVGAGMAGLVLATALARAGLKTVVLESGRRTLDQGLQALNRVEASARHTRAETGRVRIFGGASTRWGGRVAPLSASDFGAMPGVEDTAWPITAADLQPFARPAEQLLRLDNGSYDEDLLAAIDPRRLFPRQDPDFACRWVKWAMRRRGDLSRLLGAEARRSADLQVWLGATACEHRLDRERGRLASVVARGAGGRSVTVTARHFVFAAGTIETTRLLLLMDRQSDGRAFGRCEVLGRYFQDHLDAEVAEVSIDDRAGASEVFGFRMVGATRRSPQFELSPQAQQIDRVASGYVYATANLHEHPTLDMIARALRRPGAAPASVERKRGRDLLADARLVATMGYWRAARRRLYLPEGVKLRLRACVEQAPDWRNRIGLSDEQDGFGLPRARLEWRPTARDEATFRSAVTRIGAYWRRAGFDRWGRPNWSAAVLDPQGRISDAAIDFAHPSGATRMGLDPRRSVVDADLRCHHAPNVTVLGASVFPRAGSVNPSFTILQLALRAAEHLQGLGLA